MAQEPWSGSCLPVFWGSVVRSPPTWVVRVRERWLLWWSCCSSGRSCQSALRKAASSRSMTDSKRRVASLGISSPRVLPSCSEARCEAPETNLVRLFELLIELGEWACEARIMYPLLYVVDTGHTGKGCQYCESSRGLSHFHAI